MFLKKGHFSGLSSGINISCTLSQNNETGYHNFSEVVRFHGIDALVTMLKDSRQNAAANAAIVLTNMAPDEGNRSAILQAGLIAALLEPLQSPYVPATTSRQLDTC